MYTEKATIRGRLNLHRFSPRLRTSSYASTNYLAREVIFSQLRQIATVLTHQLTLDSKTYLSMYEIE